MTAILFRGDELNHVAPGEMNIGEISHYSDVILGAMAS